MKPSTWATLVFVALMIPGIVILAVWDRPDISAASVIPGFIAAQVVLILDSDERRVQ